MNYEEIKALAKELHVPVAELIALAPQNDPFYTGTPRDRELGAWFRDLWEAFGFTTGVHIRRMHYAIVSQNPPVKFPNGKPYENTEACWNELTNAAKAARYLEYVDPAAFVDRRNDDPVDSLDYWTSRRAEVSVEEVDDSEVMLPDMPDKPGYSFDAWETPQRYHLEIWCEKSTMNDILEPLVRRYNAALVYGKGELSITAALAAINRFQRSEKPVRIFYVSDFDPAGAGMPVSMSRKLEYFVRHMGLDMDIKLFPVVLTHAQAKQYTRLLPTPIKDTERRKAGFEAKYGGGAIELDALEALYPGELHRVLVREMERYYDNTLRDRVWTAQQETRRQLQSAEREVYGRYASDIQAIDEEWQGMQEQVTQLLQWLQAHKTRRVELWQTIQQDLQDEQPDISEDEIPEAAEALERNGALYDSRRNYLEQNRVYQAHKANMSHYQED